MKFSTEYQPEGRGRPKGSKNKPKPKVIDERTKKEAQRQLSDAVKNGESWAIELALTLS